MAPPDAYRLRLQKYTLGVQAFRLEEASQIFFPVKL